MQEKINRLQDFCDMEALQHILKNWSRATNMGVVVFNLSNEVIIGPYGFPNYCHLIYSTQAGKKCCKQNNLNDISEFICEAGLNEFIFKVGLPDGRIIAKIICGQIKSPHTPVPYFDAMATKLEMPERAEKLSLEYRKISTKTSEEMDASRELLSSVIDTFIDKSYRSWLANREKNTDRTLSQLTQQIFGYNVTVNLTNMQYELVIGAGMEDTVEAMKHFSDYIELNRQLVKNMPEESLKSVNALIGVPALQKRAGMTGYIGQVIYNVKKEDKVYWHKARLFMGFNENGDPIANILGRDITKEHEQADAIAQLKAEREASAAKSRFLSNMSHDIRTPLNGIIGMLAIAKNHRQEEAIVDDCLDKINIASRHLLTLINDILDLNKLQSGKMFFAKEPCNLLKLIQEIGIIVKPLAVEAKVHFPLPELDIKHTDVICSQLHIRQVVVNILTNAIKYNRPGGHVITVIKESACDEDNVYIECTVTDDGIGMSEEFQRHMFNPFEQDTVHFKANSQGTGLGLAIVKQIIDQLGGSIEVTSKENEGTCFKFTIPFAINKSDKEEKLPENLLTPDITGTKILLVEDNELNMEIAQMLLEDAGAIVSTATDGELAVKTFSENPPESFDIILMDIQMPKMDGLAATRAIRALPRPDAATVPIFAMSANAFADDVIIAKEAGMNEHLAKPIDLPKILSTIAMYVKRK